MSNWKTVRLGDVCVLNYGKSLVATNRKIGNIPVYSSAGITGYHNEPLINGEGIIIGRKGTVGSVYHSITPFCCIDTAYYVLPNENYDFKFLYYRLKSLGLEKLNEDSAVPGLNRETAYSQEFLLPPLAEQERIARILGSLDDKIECNNRINRNLEEQAAALFRRWFVDFEFPDPDPTSPTYGKPYRSAGGKMTSSPLGSIPQGWQVGKFTDIIDILGGGTPNTGTNGYWNGQIPFFTPKDAKDNLYTISTEKYITDKGLDKCNSKLYPEETVFITARGTVGKVAIAGCDMAMNQSCYALVGKNSIGQYFVYHITKETVLLLRNKASGAVFDAITTRDFESELIIIPAEKLSYEFNDTVKSLMKLILSNTVENRTLATLRDTLLPKLMNNQIKI